MKSYLQIMTMISKLILVLMGVLLSEKAFSYNSYTCDKTFRIVQVGDSMDTVRVACGEPTTSKNIEKPVTTSVTTAQWIYTLGLIQYKGIVLNLSSLAISFRDQKVIAIARSGAIVTNGYCAINGRVNLGDTMTQVLTTCGQPNLVNNLQEAINSTKSITEWIYDNGPYKPQILFDFEAGKLTEIITGQLGR